MPLTRIFLFGCWISFLGTLPLGTLNVFAAQLAVNEGVGPALWFSIGALLVEMCYVRLSLVAMDWVRRKREWFRALEWVTVCIVALLAIGSFRAAYHAPENGSMVIGLGSHPGIYYLLAGALLSAVNPLQIPFWFGWSTVLCSKNILQLQRVYCGDRRRNICRQRGIYIWRPSAGRETEGQWKYC
jgi:threonine/homoserine/homoserine lactone efflux protein